MTELNQLHPEVLGDLGLLIVGGSKDHPGGVEAFCKRAEEALEMHRTGWRIYQLASNSAYLSFRRLPGFISAFFSLFRYRKECINLVWLQYVNFPDLLFVPLSRMLGFKVLVTPHLGANWRSQSNPIFRALSAWLLNSANGIALLSPTQETEIKLPASVRHFHLKTFLPLEMLQSSGQENEPPTGQLRLMHSGRLSAGKGSFLFIDVCSRLHQIKVPFRATVSGTADKPTMAALALAIEQKGLGEYIKLVGRKTVAEQADLLHRSDVLVHLSSIDSYPLIVLEAMLCATIPICMELAGARDMVETYDGAMVPVSNPVDATVEILAQTTPSAFRQRGSLLSKRLALDYEWKACVLILETAIVGCISSTDVGDHASAVRPSRTEGTKL